MDFLKSSSIGEKSVWNEAGIQSCYVTVHVTCTSALYIENARTLKTAVDNYSRQWHLEPIKDENNKHTLTCVWGELTLLLGRSRLNCTSTHRAPCCYEVRQRENPVTTVDSSHCTTTPKYQMET